ncbi:MAG: glycosyltransferase [Dictyoglomaceae bacterium]
MPIYNSLSKEEAKQKFGLSDKLVISTFGLINPEKGIEKVKELNLENNVIKEQICSGTLAYAIGFGKTIISTPYLYAEEILNNNRGILVDFRNAKAISEAIDRILKNPDFMKTLEKKALEFGKQMK